MAQSGPRAPWADPPCGPGPGPSGGGDDEHTCRTCDCVGALEGFSRSVGRSSGRAVSVSRAAAAYTGPV